jgi:monofunctional biosynthetic peptidoglycan transglycosylase
VGFLLSITVLGWLKRLVGTFLVLTVGGVLLYKFVPVPYTWTMAQRAWEDREGNLPRFDLRHDWVPLERISPHLRKAVICTEDQLFLLHSGFDFQAVDQAQAERQAGTRERGASTLTQQTAKNVFLWQRGGWVRKGLEAYFAVLVELMWSKRRILECYLNVAEMGDGIFGAEAAAQVYFHKPAANLTPREAALLAACLPNPRAMNPARPSPYHVQRANYIVGAMAQMPPEYYEAATHDD